MIILLPTAKEMALTEPVAPKTLNATSQAILNSLLALDINSLSKAYKLKKTATETERERWLAIQSQTAMTYPAVQLFNGLMYRQFNQNLTADDWAYLRQVYITSSFYGIVPANEPMAPHRLDFHTAIKVDKLSLKQVWQDHYDAFLSQQDQPVISLLSSEFESVFSAKLRKKLIQVEFREETADGQLKKHSTISKKGRGQLLKACMREKVQSLDQLRSLKTTDWHYRADLSTENKLFFIKTH